MRRLAPVGAFIFVSFLVPPFGSAQIPSLDNLYVLQARPRQATTSAPLTLTFIGPCGQERKRALSPIEITIPPADVIDSLTTRVRAQKFEGVSMSELFVLDVRSRKIPASTSDPLVLTLASGAVISVPPGCVHSAATRWLRVNLPNETRVSASTAPVTEPTTSDATCRADQSAAAGGSSVQFDAKGIDFSSWLRRFTAQVRRNWFIPESVRTARGCVVVTFRVHKSGAISDVAVLTPSSLAAFNTSALGAVAVSNPTVPLPPEYPDESAFFTVTFYFNESPPKGW